MAPVGRTSLAHGAADRKLRKRRKTPGSHEAWVENLNGAAGEATIEVFVGGKQRETAPATVSVPGAAMGRSPVVTFTLP